MIQCTAKTASTPGIASDQNVQRYQANCATIEEYTAPTIQPVSAATPNSATTRSFLSQGGRNRLARLVTRSIDSLSAYGLDSLQTLRLSKAIQSSLYNGTRNSALETIIYSNTTVDKIAQALTNLRNGEAVPGEDSESAMAEMKRILYDYQNSLETVNTVSARPSGPPK